MELLKDVGELGNCKSEKNSAEEALSESEKMAMEMELNKVEQAKKNASFVQRDDIGAY